MKNFIREYTYVIIVIIIALNVCRFNNYARRIRILTNTSLFYDFDFIIRLRFTFCFNI